MFATPSSYNFTNEDTGKTVVLHTAEKPINSNEVGYELFPGVRYVRLLKDESLNDAFDWEFKKRIEKSFNSDRVILLPFEMEFFEHEASASNHKFLSTKISTAGVSIVESNNYYMIRNYKHFIALDYNQRQEFTGYKDPVSYICEVVKYNFDKPSIGAMKFNSLVDLFFDDKFEFFLHENMDPIIHAARRGFSALSKSHPERFEMNDTIINDECMKMLEFLKGVFSLCIEDIASINQGKMFYVRIKNEFGENSKKYVSGLSKAENLAQKLSGFEELPWRAVDPEEDRLLEFSESYNKAVEKGLIEVNSNQEQAED